RSAAWAPSLTPTCTSRAPPRPRVTRVLTDGPLGEGSPPPSGRATGACGVCLVDARIGRAVRGLGVTARWSTAAWTSRRAGGRTTRRARSEAVGQRADLVAQGVRRDHLEVPAEPGEHADHA